jgi:hypothetical protein
VIRPKLLTALGDPGIYIGEREFLNPGQGILWEVPQAVRRIHICCIGAGAQGAYNPDEYPTHRYGGGGGGGLGWANDIEVEPGEILAIQVGQVVGAVYGYNGDSWVKRTDEDDSPTGSPLVAGNAPTPLDGYFDGGTFIGQGGGNGGNGFGGDTWYGSGGAEFWSYGSGGGAGGYNGNGGDGTGRDATAGGSGGGASGGASATNWPQPTPSTGSGFRGGGVGIKGEGASGASRRTADTPDQQNAGGGVGYPGSGGEKEEYGAGGAGYPDRYGEDSKTAGHGAVRIIWGNKFSYPNKADVEAE